MHQQANEDESLQGQIDAINQLFSEHYQRSFRTAYRILHSREDSEDAVQTAYCAAFRDFQAFRKESGFKTWITRIVVNCCFQQLRERRSRPQVALDDAQCSPAFLKQQSVTPEELCYQRELQAAHRQAASRLSPKLDAVYTPCVIAGAEFAKVARQLGLTTGAAKSRLLRARKKVESALGPALRRSAA